MFNSIDQLEKTMASILHHVQDVGRPPCPNGDSNLAYALFCCCEDGYIINLPHQQNQNADYIFDLTANVLVSEAGLRFLKNKSMLNRIKLAAYDILKGTLGYILGISSSAIADLIVYCVTGSGIIEHIAKQIQVFFP